MIRSINTSQDQILKDIIALHCPDGFECDVTYGKGCFYKHIPQPKFKFDIEPQVDGVERADSSNLPLLRASVGSLVFDPPFLTYIRSGRAHKAGKVAMSKRFGGYYTYEELVSHYCASIREADRVLKQNGILVVKCQDIVHNHRLHLSHSMVLQAAALYSLRPLDLFVLAAIHRMPGPQKGKQRHARVFHSYFLVFKKAA